MRCALVAGVQTCGLPISARRNALLSATSTGGPAPGQRSIVAGNLLLPFVPLLRFNRHCGNGAGFQSSERDWLAGDFAIAIFAIVNPAQRCVDFRYELALAIASTNFDSPIPFPGRPRPSAPPLGTPRAPPSPPPPPPPPP